MRVSKDRIEELRRLYKDAYGQDLSEEEARDLALRLVSSIDYSCGPCLVRRNIDAIDCSHSRGNPRQIVDLLGNW